METKNKAVITLLLLGMMIFIFYFASFWISKTTGMVAGNDAEIVTAQCLGEKGAVFYGSDACSECIKQINEFGYSFRFINYIDCGKRPDFCKGIESVPVWKINGTQIKGFLNIENISRLAGC